MLEIVLETGQWLMETAVVSPEKIPKKSWLNPENSWKNPEGKKSWKKILKKILKKRNPERQEKE